MFPLDTQPFQPLINSSHASFTSSALALNSTSYALESTGVRQWQLPSSRTVRLSGVEDRPYYVRFGTSAVNVGASNGMLCWGSKAQYVNVTPGQTHIAIYSSTSQTVNITLGIGR